MATLREKHVYTSTREIAHLWASGNKDNARTPTAQQAYGKGSQFHFEGRFLYSYRTVIGVRMNDKEVPVSTHNYSPTTNGHYSDRTSATSHLHSVYINTIPRSAEDVPWGETGYKKTRQYKRFLEDVTAVANSKIIDLATNSKVRLKASTSILDALLTMERHYENAKELGAKGLCVVKLPPDNEVEERSASNKLLLETMIAFRKKYTKEWDKAEVYKAFRYMQDMYRMSCDDEEKPGWCIEKVEQGIEKHNESGMSIHLQATKKEQADFKKLRDMLNTRLRVLKNKARTQVIRNCVKELRTQNFFSWEGIRRLVKIVEEEIRVVEPLIGHDKMVEDLGGEEEFSRILETISASKKLYMEQRVAALYEKYELAMKLPSEDYYNSHLHVMEEVLKEYSTLRTKYPDVAVTVSPEEHEALVRHRDGLKKIVDEKRARVLEDWREHISNPFAASQVRSFAPALRVSKDGKSIQTSWGAEVPVEVCPALWIMVGVARQKGEDIVRDFGEAGKVGYYRLTEVKADGSLIVGCHNIPGTEIDYIAKKLGYV